MTRKERLAFEKAVLSRYYASLGKARARKMTAKRRSEIAQIAARARWRKVKVA